MVTPKLVFNLRAFLIFIIPLYSGVTIPILNVSGIIPVTIDK